MLSHKSVPLTFFLLSISFIALPGNPKREMRGVWIATVKNLDWPSRAGLHTNRQKQETAHILTHVKALGFNAVFLQVRPSSDAFYKSAIEPWSKYLSGKQGTGPKPGYDPLEFWINAAHKKGIEVHAWINPYRVTSGKNEKLAPNHPLLQHPDWLLRYGNKLYLDPGIPGVVKYIDKIIADIVRRYDIDGIHLDDYFYPYPDSGTDFPDTASFEAYCDTSVFSSKDQWRRDNVNRTIKSIHSTIKRIKPWVSFGISPFGVWRNMADDPRGSDTQAAITNYDDLYADILTWTKNGWVDYIAPQIYWYMNHPQADFNELAHWWNNNSYNTPVFVGTAIYKINSDKPQWQDPSEIPDEISLCRKLKNIQGNIFFRYSFLNNDLLGLQDSLKYKFYSTIALTPVVKGNLDIPPVRIEKIKASRKKLKWKTDKTNADNVKFFVVYSYSPDKVFDAGDTKQIFSVTNANYLIFPHTGKDQKKFYRVSAIDLYGNEGPVSLWVKQK